MRTRVNNLIKIGFWYSEKEPTLPMPVENSSKSFSKQDRQKIIAYLNDAETKASYRGWSDCRLCGCMNGSSEKTDGEFLWPSGLTHYFEKHNVELPESLIKKILSND